MTAGAGRADAVPAVAGSRVRSRGPFRRVAAVLGITAFGAGIPTPLYSVYEAEFHFGAEALAVVFGAYTVGVLTTMFFVAPMSDAIGRKPVLYAGMGLTALSGAIFLVANGVVLLAVARIVSGLAVGATTSTATAAMAILEPRQDQHHVARVSVAANFGGVGSGVLLSGFLVEYAPQPTALVFWVLIVVSALGAVALVRSPETVPLAERRGPIVRQRLQVPSSIRVPFGIATLGLAACYSIYGFFGALAPTFVRVGLGLPGAAETGAIVATMFGFAAIAQLALAEVRDRAALLIGFPLLIAALAVFILSLLFAALPLLLGGAALLGVAIGFTFMGSVTLIDRVAPEAHRGEVLSAFYIVGYLSLALPTVGIAFASTAIGLGSAAAAFGLTLGLFVAGGYAVTLRTPTPPGGEGRPRGAS